MGHPISWSQFILFSLFRHIPSIFLKVYFSLSKLVGLFVSKVLFLFIKQFVSQQNSLEMLFRIIFCLSKRIFIKKNTLFFKFFTFLAQAKVYIFIESKNGHFRLFSYDILIYLQSRPQSSFYFLIGVFGILNFISTDGFCRPFLVSVFFSKSICSSVESFLLILPNSSLQDGGNHFKMLFSINLYFSVESFDITL